MNYGQAIELLKRNHKIARAGWNGKNMFVFLTRGSKPSVYSGSFGGVADDLFELGDSGTSVRMPNITLKAADGSTVNGWVASQVDTLADDWEVVA